MRYAWAVLLALGSVVIAAEGGLAMIWIGSAIWSVKQSAYSEGKIKVAMWTRMENRSAAAPTFLFSSLARKSAASVLPQPKRRAVLKVSSGSAISNSAGSKHP
jgi:hypothetical protein